MIIREGVYFDRPNALSKILINYHSQNRIEEIAIRKTLYLSIVVCLLLSAPLLLFSNTYALSGPDGTFQGDYDVFGTYLLTDPFLYGPSNGHPASSPLIVDLEANGMHAGDMIMISFDGIFYPGILWDGDTSWNITQDKLLMTGVFSSTNELLPSSQLNRVPGAIFAYSNSGGVHTPLTVETPLTNFGQYPTDIPQDFEIRPYTGMMVEVPISARYLFICHPDSYYSDNGGSITVKIEKDTDGDGLADSWEINGVDINKDGVVDLHLSALGADWQHKDIFVEVDYMGSSGNHNHRPNQDSINDVIQAFDLAPVANPDGVSGINLHVLIDETLPHADIISWTEFDSLKGSYFGTLAERTNRNNIDAKRAVFHYCIFAHQQVGTTSSGLGEYPGNDFLVTLGGFSTNPGTRDQQAATFMHELGHNLGLGHGGGDAINYKPNYISVMNYLFQFDDYNLGRSLDFSEGGRNVLNEGNLNETDGIGSYEETVWRSPNGTLCSNDGDYEIDWNFDGNFTGSVQVNLNNHVDWDYVSPAGETLTDFDDWKNIVYNFRSTLGFALGQHPNVPVEITAELDAAMRAEALTVVSVSPPTSSPTPVPTPSPTPTPNATPTVTLTPTPTPTPTPTVVPTATLPPTPVPTATQTPNPTQTASPTTSPTTYPTAIPSPQSTPTSTPSATSSPQPTASPQPQTNEDLTIIYAATAVTIAGVAAGVVVFMFKKKR